MPKGSRSRTKKQTGRDAAAVDSAQKLDTQEDTPQHPRTRAWVKQEAEGQKVEEEKARASAIPPPSPRRQRLKRLGVAKDPLPTRQQEPTQISTRSVSRSRPHRGSLVNKAGPAKQPAKPQAKQKVKQPAKQPAKQATTKQARQKAKGNQKLRTGAPAGETPQQRGQTGNSRGPSFAAWLDEIESVSPEGLRQTRASCLAPDPDDLYRPEDMDSRSTSRGTGDDGSTVRVQGSRSVKLSEAKLRLRRVKREPTTDNRLQHLRSIVKTRLPERPLKDIGELRSVTENFLHQIATHPNDSCYSYIDDFSFDFDQSKSKINYPAVNRRYFEADLKRCLARNEAVLQRTIMIHIINQYWLGEIFDWNSEGQWIQPKETRLPSREDDDISLPKPDLAISFTLKSFTGDVDDSDPIPPELEKCISPDSGDRCFPFLFFEVKKAGADLQEAYTANLHSASQALYNIYNWMLRAGQEDEFLNTVRVFSVVFNAQDLSVRIHRAVKLPIAGGALGFQFDEFSPLGRYTKDQACLLIHTILTDYAAEELHPLLKTAFLEVVKQEDERVASKRKLDAERHNAPKRSKRNLNNTQHTGQSFEMSNLST